MKEYLFFDLDGTLSDPSEGIINSILYALKRYGIEESDRNALYSFIGPPLVDAFGERYGVSREKGYEMTTCFQEYFSQKGLYENRLYKGIPELLCSLSRQGKKLVLATSKPEEFAIRILEHFGILPYFTCVCGATMDEKTRCEKSDVLRYALATVDADPADAVMVGDRKYDIAAANALGLVSVGVTYGFGSQEELEAAGAAFLCPSVEELKLLLEQEKESL
jgi:phosphoglycolate phosphatase